MNYTLENKNKNGTCPAQLTDKIKTVALALGHTPSQLEFAKFYPSGHVEAIYRTYGSWTNAVRVAGLVPKGSGRQAVYSKQSLINIMRDFREQWGRQPHWRDFYDRNGLPSHTVLLKHFGSYSTAIQEAFNDYDVTKNVGGFYQP